MDRRAANSVASRFSEYIEHLSGHWPRGPARPAGAVLHRLAIAGRAQERRADGGADRAR